MLSGTLWYSQVLQKQRDVSTFPSHEKHARALRKPLLYPLSYEGGEAVQLRPIAHIILPYGKSGRDCLEK
jgi:hypothetical protein